MIDMIKTLLFFNMLLLTCTAFAQTRNLKIVKAPTENPTNEQRKAIVIGMSDYGADRSLNNTLNDANDMADVFGRLGFEVTLLENNDLRNLSANLSAWYQTIERNDMAVFYFAGHGMELDGQNYLIPVDAAMSSQADVKFATLNVNQVLANMEEKGVAMKLLILDACRDNPFKRSWNQGRGSNAQGLAIMSAPEGAYFAFAASPGTMAQDGGNYNLRNGVFTHFIKQEIIKAGATIDEIFNKVTGGVSNLTNKQQTPFKNSSLTANFYFIPPRNVNPPPNNPVPPSNVNPPPNNPVPPHNNNPPPNNPVPPSNVSVEEVLRQAEELNTYNRNNEAIPLYRRAAEQGNAVAQYRLGQYYYDGKAVPKDRTQAVEWFRKAAEQGYAVSQNHLGLCYQYGYGIAIDLKQAVFWYRKAADQGDENAKDNLSYMGIKYR